MKSEYITPFVDAVHNTFETMIGASAKAGPPTLRKPGEPATVSYQICGVIGYSGGATGRVAIGFNEEVARKVVASFIGVDDPASLPSGDVSDGVGELTNMVAGAAKASLHVDGEDIVTLSVPNVLSGDALTVSSSSEDASLLVPFETSFGVFHLEVAFKTRA